MANKILITGAGGFVGPHLIRELQKDPNNEIFASVYSPTSDISSMVPDDHIILGDLTDYKYAKQLIQDSSPDIVYHLAALSIVHNSVEQASRVLTANMSIQYNILEAVKNNAPSARFVAICSANVYGLVKEEEVPISESQPLRPLNPYAVSKLSQEFLALEYHLAHSMDIVILRPFNHTGVGQTENFVIPALAKQFRDIKLGKTEPKLNVGNTESIRDFTDVRDMVRAYVLAGEKCQSGEVYNIGSGKGSSVGQIISMLEEISGIKVETVTHPDRVRASDVPVLIADNTKFVAETGWSPQISFKETLESVYNRN